MIISLDDALFAWKQNHPYYKQTPIDLHSKEINTFMEAVSAFKDISEDFRIHLHEDHITLSIRVDNLNVDVIMNFNVFNNTGLVEYNYFAAKYTYNFNSFLENVVDDVQKNVKSTIKFWIK